MTNCNFLFPFLSLFIIFKRNVNENNSSSIQLERFHTFGISKTLFDSVKMNNILYFHNIDE